MSLLNLFQIFNIKKLKKRIPWHPSISDCFLRRSNNAPHIAPMILDTLIGKYTQTYQSINKNVIMVSKTAVSLILILC